jgi:hypothetical protein
VSRRAHGRLAGAITIAIAVIAPASASASGALNACELRSAPTTAISPAAVPLQGEAEDSGLEGGRAPVEGGTPLPGPTAEELLGAQYGGQWFEDATPTYYIGLLAGALTSAEATARADAVMHANLGASEAAFLETHTVVLEVPYSPAELQADRARIQAELQAALPGVPVSAGLGVGEADGASADYWPQVDVTLMGSATEADCETALALLAPYGGAASVTRTSGEAVAAAQIEPAPPRLGQTPRPSAPGPTTRGSSPGAPHIEGRLTRGVLRLTLRLPAGTSGAIRITISPFAHRRLARILRTLRSSHPGVLRLTIPLARVDRRRRLGRIVVSATVVASGASSSVTLRALSRGPRS